VTIPFLAESRFAAAAELDNSQPPLHAPRSTTPPDLPKTAIKPPGLDGGAVAVLKPTVQIKRSVLQEPCFSFFRACLAEATMDIRPTPHPIGGFLCALRDSPACLRWNRPAIWKLNQFSHAGVIGWRGYGLEVMLIKVETKLSSP